MCRCALRRSSVFVNSPTASPIKSSQRRWRDPFRHIVQRSAQRIRRMTPRVDMLLKSWSWSHAPNLFKVALLLAICVEAGLIRNVQSKTFNVGDGYVDIMGNTTWTNTINGLLQPVALEAAYQKWADSVNVTVGDTLNFYHERGEHTVYLVKNESAYNSCDLLADSGQTIPFGTPTTYTIKDTDSVLYFTCSVSGHCRGGQKVKIVPFGVTISPTPTPLPPPAPNSAHASSASIGTIAILLLALLFML